MLIILYIKTFLVPQSHAEEKWKMENNRSQHEVKTKAIIVEDFGAVDENCITAPQ
jgi:hypothetical protein